ncbi:SGNH hydrolase [Ceratobasidium sp. AG-I]|nr:SGNH hydrolase [Ceratobasidium sp. AG-I]
MFARLFVGLSAVAALSAAVPHKIAPSVLTIGDSTVTSDAGWGAGFCSDTRGLANCTNLSVSGTTTVSWKGFPQYQTMLASCKTPETYATIQFGHNDQKVMNKSYFATNLESLTLIIQNAGCKPILVTSLARRVFTSEHVTSDILGPYSNETINVAAKLNLPLLPLLNDSLTYITKLGKTKSMLFNWDSATTNKDTTHLNYLGWEYFGRIVADEVHKYIPALSHYIVPNITLSQAIANGTILPGDIPAPATTTIITTTATATASA